MYSGTYIAALFQEWEQELLYVQLWSRGHLVLIRTVIHVNFMHCGSWVQINLVIGQVSAVYLQGTGQNAEQEFVSLLWLWHGELWFPSFRDQAAETVGVVIVEIDFKGKMPAADEKERQCLPISCPVYTCINVIALTCEK